MTSRKPEQHPEIPAELPQERLQWVVPDRSQKTPSLPRWRPTSDIRVEFPKKVPPRLH
jgi:hypothetical protein